MKVFGNAVEAVLGGLATASVSYLQSRHRGRRQSARCSDRETRVRTNQDDGRPVDW